MNVDKSSATSLRYIVCIFGIALLLMLMYYTVVPSCGRRFTVIENHRNSFLISTTQNTSHEINEPVVILAWTKVFGKNWSHWHMPGIRLFQNCKYDNCILTDDRSFFKKAKMLLFHNQDLLEFPKERYSYQLYVHGTLEPPSQGGREYIEQFEDRLNLTSNYRPDADVFSPYSYFQYQKTDDTSYVPKFPLENKTRSVAWMVSHCLTDSKREIYVKELQRHIDVDIYGLCGNYMCARELGYLSCLQNMSRNYKFYLAFENSLCPYYHTEKLSNALSVEMIPIVLGKSNYTHDHTIAPPHSVIDVRDFNSPKHLAEYLHYLGNNQSEYYKYFEWKSHYISQNFNAYCEYCRILHSDSYLRGERIVPSYKKYGGFSHWWYDDCDNDMVTRMKEDGNW